jgi:hypothetical protein
MGIFLTQKQVKAGEGYFQVCTTRKSRFWLWLWMTTNPLIVLLAFGKK